MNVAIADEGDVPALVDLRDAAAAWQQEVGVCQWRPGEVAADTFAAQVAAGEWRVLRDEAPAAAVRVLRDDPGFWGSEPVRPALYLHGLVRRRDAPAGTGSALMAWAEREAKAEGVEVLRLDCVADNSRLCDYYESLGFRRVGQRSVGAQRRVVALYEKAVR